MVYCCGYYFLYYFQFWQLTSKNGAQKRVAMVTTESVRWQGSRDAQVQQIRYFIYFLTQSVIIVITVKLLSLAQFCTEYLVIYVCKQNIFEIFVGHPKTPLTQNVSGN